MGMAAILFTCAEPFEQIVFTLPFDRRRHEKSGENCSRFQRTHLKITQFYICIYSPGIRADNPAGDKLLIVTNKF